MKKIFMFIAAAGLLMTGCGNKEKSQQTDAEEEAVEVVDEVEAEEAPLQISEPAAEPEPEPAAEEEDDGLYNPPFKVTIVDQHIDGGWEEKNTYVYNVMKNGRLSGTVKYERRDSRFQGAWEPLGSPDEFGGKWSTSSISMGDGHLKVYALDPSNRSTTYYLPATCDYIWMCDGAWFECEDWNLKKAMKVTSVEKL